MIFKRYGDEKTQWAWLARIGVGRKAGTVPIGWYQVHNDAADHIVWWRAAHLSGHEDAFPVRCKRGVVQVRGRLGRWIDLGTVGQLFDAADRVARGIESRDTAATLQGARAVRHA